MSANQHRCGDILGLYTWKAPGHKLDGRYKYHLYLGLAHDGSGKHVCMLVSTDGSDCCMSIDQNDWPSMSKKESHINCQELYDYTPSQLSRARTKGRLSDDALARLMDHAAESETLTPLDIDVVVDAIRGYFEGLGRLC